MGGWYLRWLEGDKLVGVVDPVFLDKFYVSPVNLLSIPSLLV